MEGHLEGLAFRHGPALGRKVRFERFHRPGAGGQLWPGLAGQIAVAGIQRLQNEIGRAGGAEQRQCRPHLPCLRLQKAMAQVEAGSAGEHRQGLVGGVTAEVRPLVQRVGGRGQEVEVGPVGVVHQKGRAVGVADLCQGRHRLHIAQIVRAGDVHRRRRFGQGRQGVSQHFGGHRAGQQRIGPGPKPAHIRVQQGRRVQEGLVGVAGGQHHPAFALLQRETEHGPDALAGAAGGVEGGLCPEQGGGVLLALGDDAARLIEAVGSRDFGDVPPSAAQGAFALVAGHVQAGGAALFIGGDEVADGGLHPSSPRAIWSMMAHSMRFLNSSQPCLYTPPMLPVAW